EGQIWEAATYAVHHKVDNLIATIDHNGQQIDGPTKEVLDLRDLRKKYEAFGWEVQEFDGNNLEETIKSLENARALARRGTPVRNVMDTLMRQAVHLVDGSHRRHGIAPDDAQLSQALARLEETIGDY